LSQLFSARTFNKISGRRKRSGDKKEERGEERGAGRTKGIARCEIKKNSYTKVILLKECNYRYFLVVE